MSSTTPYTTGDAAVPMLGHVAATSVPLRTV
jgi:hypothetical protein